MTNRIARLEPVDDRFPTSRQLNGSDAMNPAPDYSAAYVTLSTDDGHSGQAFAFTIGPGNEVVVEAIRALEAAVVGTPVHEILTDVGEFSRRLVYDSRLRWLGPEKASSTWRSERWSTLPGTRAPGSNANRFGARCRTSSPRRSSTWWISATCGTSSTPAKRST